MKKKYIRHNVVGIECTCHTLEITLLNENHSFSKKDIIKSWRNFFFPPHAINPIELFEDHKKFIETHRKAIFEFLKGYTISDVFYSSGMGMPGCLKIAETFAGEISQEFNVPPTPINHSYGHYAIVEAFQENNQPTLCLFVSGKNTQVIPFNGEDFEKPLIETEDIGLGNMIDKYGRKTGVASYSGPEITRLAQKYQGTDSLNLPEVWTNKKQKSFFFSGLLEACLQYYKKGEIKEKIAKNMLLKAFKGIIRALKKSLDQFPQYKRVLCFGGVTSNIYFKQMVCEMIKERNLVEVIDVPVEYLVDNGTMIAVGGLRAKKSYSYLN